MPTIADLKRGSLVRWWGTGDHANRHDIDELGVVTRIPGDHWSGDYRIVWAISKSESHHSSEMIEESVHQGQMEIVG